MSPSQTLLPSPFPPDGVSGGVGGVGRCRAEGVTPEYEGGLKRPTLSLQRPRPLHPTPQAALEIHSEKAVLRTMTLRYWGGGSWASGSQIGQVLALVSQGSPTHTSTGAKPCQTVAGLGTVVSGRCTPPGVSSANCCHYLPIFM